MFTVYKTGTRRTAGFLWALCAVVAVGGSALESRAQIPPPNDNLTNAQGLVGLSGSVQGNNLNATVQTGEPAPVVGVPAQSTIWYTWTAPITVVMDFNTRGSTDPDGLPLETTLAVYESFASPPTPARLIKIVGNQDDPSGGVTSRVDFLPRWAPPITSRWAASPTRAMATAKATRF